MVFQRTHKIIALFILLITGALVWFFFVPRGTRVHVDIKRAFDKENVVPLAVIGSGPAGFAAALYGARGNVKTVVFMGNSPGGQLMGTSHVENWPGTKRILGRELMKNMQDQVTALGAELFDEVIERVNFGTWPFELYTQDGQKVNALSVVIATGASPRLLKISGESEYWGKGVTTCAICDAPFFKGKSVIVVGGGDSAVEEAIQLAVHAKTVTVLVRKDRMRAAPSMQERLKEYENITISYNTELKEILGNGTHVTEIDVLNNRTGVRAKRPIDGVFLAIGHIPNSQVFADYLKRGPHGHIKIAHDSQATSLPGIFAAGEIEDTRYRQAGTSAGRGIGAALDAIGFLNEAGFNATVADNLTMNYLIVTKGEAGQVGQLLTVDELEEAAEQSEVPLVLDFFAESCPSCMQMLPHIQHAAHNFAGKLKFFKIDAGNPISRELLEKFFCTKVPCLVIYHKGKLISRHDQAMTKKELYDYLTQFVN